MAKGKVRDRRLEAQWRRAMQAQGRSGLGVREFCRRGGLTESAFHFWRRELRQRDTECAVARPAFVPVRVVGGLSGLRAAAADRAPACNGVPAAEAAPAAEGIAPGRIVIELPGGRRVRVAAPVDRQALADVLAVLRLDELTAPSTVEGEGQAGSACVAEGGSC
jgi:transposase-like protein